LGVCSLATPLISGTGKAADFKFDEYIYRANPSKKPIQNLGENGAWAYPEIAQIFWVPPIISGTAKATDFKFGGYIYGAYPNKSPLKVLEKRERGRIQGLPNFWVPPIIPGTGKATNFKFCRNIHRVDRNKRP